MNDITAIILTYNEELHIKRCILSLQPIVSKIFIVDSFSTDRTIELAESLGARAIRHEFVNHAKQFQWALDNLSIESEWIIRLDADEYLLPELIEEIEEKLPAISTDVTGINLKCRYVFWDHWIRHGTRYPLVLLRIWRKDKGRIVQRWMDEHIVVSEGGIVTFEHDFCDHNLNDLSWWTDKHNRYATREAIEVLNRKYHFFPADDAMVKETGLSQTRLKRIIKERIYIFLPVFSGPIAYFFYRYFLRLGFLDGKAGIAYHFLQGFWYRFLVEAKIFELDEVLRKIDSNELKREKLEQLTGYSLKYRN